MAGGFFTIEPLGKPIAIPTARIKLKFLQLHSNPPEGIYTTKFRRKYIPRRKNEEAEMTELPCKNRRKASIFSVGKWKRHRQDQRISQRLVTHGSIIQGQSFDCV